jgi:hypothetical protein
MENAENLIVPVKKKDSPKRWTPNGSCGLNSSRTIPDSLKQWICTTIFTHFQFLH